MEVPGHRLNDFSIDQELGQGSYGMIYKVRSLRTGGTYVIKKINIDLLSQKSRREFIHEADILKRISHPHIVKYFCSFTESNFLCIVMEYIDGGDLHRLIKTQLERKSQLKEAEIWRMSYELASAIEYLHSKNIIHRDVKTLNVLVTKDYKIKLADLGASKIVSGEMQVTRVGTPLYLAPELVKHRPYDFKVDVWALGCVVYNLACLQPPFQAENLITLGIQIVSKTPDPIPMNYSLELAEFIMKMLAKQPIDRPNIQAVLAGIPKREMEGAQDIQPARMSPEVSAEGIRGKFCGSRSMRLCIAESEPVQCKHGFKERIEVKKRNGFERTEGRLATDERPSTAARNRVVIRFSSRIRPVSAVSKKNPLFNPREVHSFRIPPCVRVDFRPEKNMKTHITINSLINY